jgi:ubiquinone biosynthesis UbiH/UbiF/VisC/COQ6 family hydroxylase
MSTRPTTPIVVCGTGIVGLATALALARRGQPVTLLGPRQTFAPTTPDVFHPRVYAISPASQQFLASLGVWNMLDAQRLTAVQAMEIHGDGAGLVNLNAWQAAIPQLAWIVESGEIERVLTQAVQIFGLNWIEEKFATHHQVYDVDHQAHEASLATKGQPVRATYGQVTREPTGQTLPYLTTDQGNVVQAELFIAADGAQSPLRTAVGLPVDSKPYGVTAIVAHLNCARPHQGTALQWFNGQGVLALLPMPSTLAGAQVSMVWSLKEPLAQELLDLPLAEQATQLSARLAALTSGRLGALTLRSPLHAFPLSLTQSPMIAERIALVGDAAHRVHPLAGQGLNLGLGDVEALVNVLAEREAFRSAGDAMVLRRYRRARAEPVLAIRAVTDGLHRLFEAQNAPVAWLRNLGMSAVEKLPMIKRSLIAGASR